MENKNYMNISNEKKNTRSGLLNSISKESVFCLYFKIFGGKNVPRVASFSYISGKHEERERHIIQ